MNGKAGRTEFGDETHTQRDTENYVLNLFFNLSLVRHVHNAMIMESRTYVNLHILTRVNLSSATRRRRCCRVAVLSHSFHFIIYILFWHSLFHLLFFFLNLISRSRTLIRSSWYECVCVCVLACLMALCITRSAINAQINYVIESFIICIIDMRDFSVFHFKLEKHIVHTGHEMKSAASKWSYPTFGIHSNFID